MDLTAPKIAEKELVEAPDMVGRKAQTLANQIKKSKHFIAFTGAGISSSAGKLDTLDTMLLLLSIMKVFLTFEALMGIGH